MKKYRLTELGKKSLEGNKGVFIVVKNGMRYDLGKLTDAQAELLLDKNGNSRFLEEVSAKK